MSEEELQYDEIMPHVGQLLDELMEHSDPTVSRKVEEILDWIDTFHRTGLGQLVEMVRQWRGELFLEDAARDPIIGTFLDTYDLGEGRESEVAARDAVEAALEEVRPFVESHGGTIVVDSITDGVVKVQMLGSCDGCPSSTATLTGGVETALKEHWPNFRRLEVVDPNAPEEAPANGSSGSPEPSPVLLQIRGHEGE
jgi:Fe-S cluster biogenesis protein NfuA